MEREEAMDIRDKALAGYIAQGEHQLRVLSDQINGLIKQHSDMTDEVNAMKEAREALEPEPPSEAPEAPPCVAASPCPEVGTGFVVAPDPPVAGTDYEEV